VRVEDPPPEIEAGLKVKLPEDNPLSPSWMVPENPAIGVAETVRVTVPPLVVAADVGETASENVGAGSTVNVAVVVD
jgi:hypothetical protein